MQPSEPNYWDPGNEVEGETTVRADTATIQGGEAGQSAPEESAAFGSDSISWEASEYLQHDNGIWWYVGFFAVAAILVVVSILLKDWFFIPLIIVMAVAGIMHVRRPPRVLHYRLDERGFSVDQILHPYSTYKSFSVIRDGAFYAILLMPTKRFSASTIVYFDEADGEAIVDAFGDRLPMEHHDLDSLDRFLRLIRF